MRQFAGVLHVCRKGVVSHFIAQMLNSIDILAVVCSPIRSCSAPYVFDPLSHVESVHWALSESQWFPWSLCYAKHSMSCANPKALMHIMPMFTFQLLISSASGSLCGIARAPDLILCCSIALYGLLLFYSLTKEELQGRRPLAKFLAIKLIVIFTFYQSFLVGNWFYNCTSRVNHRYKLSALAGRAIHGMWSSDEVWFSIPMFFLAATEFWTATNVANGINALATCIEVKYFPDFVWIVGFDAACCQDDVLLCLYVVGLFVQGIYTGLRDSSYQHLVPIVG